MNMKQSINKERELNEMLESLRLKQQETETELSVLKKEHKVRLDKIKDIKKQLEKLKKKNQPAEITISDHALIRYMERILGADVKELKNKLITDNLKNQVSTLGPNGTYSAGEYKVILKNNVVVTII